MYSNQDVGDLWRFFSSIREVRVLIIFRVRDGKCPHVLNVFLFSLMLKRNEDASYHLNVFIFWIMFFRIRKIRLLRVKSILGIF